MQIALERATMEKQDRTFVDLDCRARSHEFVEILARQAAAHVTFACDARSGERGVGRGAHIARHFVQVRENFALRILKPHKVLHANMRKPWRMARDAAVALCGARHTATREQHRTASAMALIMQAHGGLHNRDSPVPNYEQIIETSTQRGITLRIALKQVAHRGGIAHTPRDQMNV